jgi:hypothetical protein
MMDHSSRGFKRTKRIKQGKAKMYPEFVPLANWIYDTYKVKPLNIRYETYIVGQKKKGRLEIIFEFTEQYNQFYIEPYKADSLKEHAIENEFISMAHNDAPRYAKYITDNIYATFYSFQKIAKEEINELIHKDEINHLREQISSSDTWHVLRISASLIWFLYTNEQVIAYIRNGNKKAITDLYFNLLKKYDEFDYFKRDELSITLDSLKTVPLPAIMTF